MATAKQVISAALSKTGTKTAGIDITPDQESDGIFTLNNLMFELEDAGYDLGFTTISAGGDSVTVSAGELNFVITQLAGRLWYEYEDTTIPIPPALVADIDNSQNNLISTLNEKVVGLANTAQDFIFSAISRSNAKDNSRPITATEITNGIPKLNDLMFQLNADGFEFNFVALTLLTNTPVIPDYAREFVKLELALRLARESGGEPDQIMIDNAAKARKSVINKINNLTVSQTNNVQDFIHAAIARIYSQGNERPITSNEINNAIPVFNDLMLQLEADGFEFNFVAISNLTDVPVIPDDAIEFVKLLFTLRLAREMGSDPDAVIIENATAARKSLINRINNLTVSQTNNVQDFIHSAIVRVYSQNNERPITANEISNAIPKFNDLMFQLEADGFEFNFVAVSSLTDVPVIPTDAIEFVKLEFTLRLARELGSEPDTAIVENAAKARKSVINRINNLSIGSTGTAQDFIRSALNRIYSQGNERPITTTEVSNGISRFNDIISELDADGFIFGISTITALTDIPSIPDYAVRMFKEKLVIALSREYGSAVDEMMIANSIESMKAVTSKLNEKTITTAGTVQDIVFSAIERVKESSRPITITDQNNAIPILNDLMFELQSEGFEFGYQKVTSITETPVIPVEALGFIKSEMVLRVARQFNSQPDELMIAAVQGSRTAVVEGINRKFTGQTGTAQNIIFAAIQMLTLGSKPITQTQIENGLEVLNEFMTEQAAINRNFGYSLVSLLTSEHQIPNWATTWVKTNIAIRMAASLGAIASQELASTASTSEANVIRRLTVKPRIQLPTRLPLGGSNRFRPQHSANINRLAAETESGEIIVTETGERIKIDEC